MGARRGYVGLMAAALALAVGCGPIEYVNQVTRKASTEVEAAKAAQADKYSPYYYTLATEYLHKAREEAASADFQAANRFGRRSEEAAKAAKKEAIERAGKPIEQFHPNVVDGNGGAVAPLTTDDDDDGGDGGMAPLVPEDDGAGDSDDDETPPGMGSDE